jgi:hypothetical protein
MTVENLVQPVTASYPAGVGARTGQKRSDWKKFPADFPADRSAGNGWKWMEMTGKPTGNGWKVDFPASANTV